MNLKSLVFLMIFGLYSIFCWKIYTCQIKGLCDDSTTVVTEKVLNQDPIQFYKNTDDAVLNNFEKYRDSICKLSQGQRLDIVGQYFSDEINNTSFPNLGLARANKLRSLFQGFGLDTSKIALVGQKLVGNFKDSLAVMSNVTPSVVVNTSSTEVQIVTSNGITEIYFPTNSTKEIKSKVLDSFLNQIAQNATNKKIYLIGHTDNVGEETANQKLSLDRSNTVKAQLIKLGVPEGNIISEGKGSTAPKVDNSTPENRALNRRVEVRVE